MTLFYDNITEVLLNMLTRGIIDVALLATPTNHPSVIEQPLFYEEFFVCSSHDFQKQYLQPGDINPDELWLLEEGHCLRSQIINLCTAIT